MISNCPEHRYNSRGELLRVDGFRVFNSDEELVFKRAGPEILLELLDSADRYSRIEARYLHMGTNTHDYVVLSEKNRKLAVGQCVNAIMEGDREKGGISEVVDFTPLTDSEMEIAIKKRIELEKTTEWILDYYEKKGKGKKH